MIHVSPPRTVNIVQCTLYSVYSVQAGYGEHMVGQCCLSSKLMLLYPVADGG